jgi:hypothetical protein
MSLIFGKPVDIERKNVHYKAGDPVPGHLRNNRETVRQYKEQFGEDVFVDHDESATSNLALSKQLGRMEEEMRQQGQRLQELTTLLSTAMRSKSR